MNANRNLGIGSIAAIVALLGVVLAAPAEAKNPNIARPVGTTGAVPNGPSSDFVNPVPFVGSARVGKKGRKKLIDDVDITISAVAFPTAGSANALGDLVVRLTGPSGATTDVMVGGRGIGRVGGTVVTNLTLSDETPTLTCGGASSPTPPPPPPPPCGDPHATLLSPFTGTAYPGDGALSTLYGYKMKGTYTLTAFDTCGPGHPSCNDRGISAITGWRLKVTGAKP